MTVNEAIQNRQTAKVLGNQEVPLPSTENVQPLIEELIAIAGNAPFHYACHATHRKKNHPLPSIVPWRFYSLDTKACRTLLSFLKDHDLATGKIPKLLAAATALVQVTWLPNPPAQAIDGLFEPSLKNMEHIAATSAAIQNLLLAATAKKIPNYWSSGGVLREKIVFDLLQIPTKEILLGSIFLFPKEVEKLEVTVKKGKLRELKGKLNDWATWVSFT